MAGTDIYDNSICNVLQLWDDFISPKTLYIRNVPSFYRILVYIHNWYVLYKSWGHCGNEYILSDPFHYTFLHRKFSKI